MESERFNKLAETKNNLIISYLKLRNLIGFSGMLLPFILVLTSKTDHTAKLFVEKSLSVYYYTNSGDILVVTMSVIGVFLFTYNGYNKTEKKITTLASISSLGIAFCPTAISQVISSTIHVENKIVPNVFGVEWHSIFATLLFISMSIMTLVYFPKSDKQQLNTQKKNRNIIYKICGWVMVVSVVLLVTYYIWKPLFLKNIPVVLIFETIILEAFGLSWITKGQTLWPDGEHYVYKGYNELKNWLKSVFN
ncbi:hypothetical protein SGQ83_20145 [Flavobacterium sp. Fl-318]|uniref:DUF998 domain-containing protein n=1 Tax=Flavobacterium cupriresistens TaxID=2893885 RepID=A0ABU4RGG0_9FLAO|nr:MULTISPECIES: hypothetical protein [unclassified Flavobacterium]MDX6191677.1 hypothetical protein [Flavobacterium sp. Fl-318]UFH41621.1 hypothetical protein LNP23_17610 [Flavobacterium sp. F-323]